MIQDITERKQNEEDKAHLEHQLFQAQKMEAIGQLAGGVAHDFNNKLMVIMGNVTLARMDIEDSAKVLQYLEEIKRAAEHSRDITLRLLAFSRQQMISPQTLNANRIIAEALKSLPRLIGEHIAVTFVPDDSLWNIQIDPVQLDQIVMNMAVNARDAMPDGGTFVITSENITLDENSSHSTLQRIPGDYVQIAFQDSGIGMDQETLAHIFEPFFTTKEVGKGTGLGLATIYGIIIQNSGFIDVASTPGGGTIFTVFLPRHESSTVDNIHGDDAIRSGSGSILLVEDEDTVRAVTALFLRKIGYTVFEADRPSNALELVGNLSIPLDFVLTDFIMPEMNGKALMERILKIRPDIKYMYASGYSTDHELLVEAPISGINFIQKPYDLKGLGELLMREIEMRENA
jgi:nitrogen-specific signal transduction histidine kinase/ActR/RegA family two-component response regulator